jgi:AmmeMemoRadiSam system protein A
MADRITAPTGPAALTAADRAALLALARDAIRADCAGSARPDIPLSSPSLCAPRGAFVTLTTRADGRLRGCCGEYEARRPLAAPVAEMAVTSSARDPRFPPLTADELAGVRIEISALTPLVPITPEGVVIGRHGLLLRAPRHAGLLLPQVPVEWGWDIPEFLTQLCRKAGLPNGAYRRPDAELLGFEADVFGEDDHGG